MTDDEQLHFSFLPLLAAATLAVALSSFLWRPLTALRTPAPPPTQQLQPAASSSATASPEQPGQKSTRSKERRRRGKDPFRDLLKGGKKSKALLKAIRSTTDHEHEEGEHEHDHLEGDALLPLGEPGNDTASSTSRSHSPEPALDLLRAVSDHNSSDGSPRPSEATPPTDAAVNVQTASTATDHASDDTPSFPPVHSDVLTPQPRDPRVSVTSESCTKLIRARTRLRVAKIDSRMAPRLHDSTFTHSAASCPSLLISSSTHSTDGAGPSTPTTSHGPSPPPRPRSLTEAPCDRDLIAQPLDQATVSAQMQLASLHGALEAARVREEQLRVNAEQASKERDEIRWRWNEDASIWRRREAELQAQIHHLMQQLQAYAAVASFQAQQASSVPSSGFSSPTSPHVQHLPFSLPPVIQAQNSASPSAHVQALLASPMLNGHASGITAQVSYAGTSRGVSPLLWSGMGLCVPNRDAGRRTPDSSASGSSSRGRRRRRRAEDDDQTASDDESSLDGSDDEEDDIFRNNALADAILKRPESIRGLSGRGRWRSPMHENGAKDPATVLATDKQ